MRRFSLIIGLVTIVILIGGVFSLSRQNPTQDILSSTASPVTSYEYFWGEGCPHCTNVEEFLSSWEKKDKVQIEKFEVNNNRKSATALIQKAESCGISQEQVGVPFLFTPEGECIVGDEPIIDYFKNLEL